MHSKDGSNKCSPLVKNEDWVVIWRMASAAEDRKLGVMWVRVGKSVLPTPKRTYLKARRTVAARLWTNSMNLFKRMTMPSSSTSTSLSFPTPSGDTRHHGRRKRREI